MLTKSRSSSSSRSEASRSALKVGLLADLNVIDGERIMPQPPCLKYDLPAGSGRLHQQPVGIEATIKSGVVIMEHGEETGEMPGKLLRGAHAVDREHTVIRALHENTTIPVPQPHLYVDDASVVGTPFFVVDFVSSRRGLLLCCRVAGAGLPVASCGAFPRRSGPRSHPFGLRTVFNQPP